MLTTDRIFEHTPVTCAQLKIFDELRDAAKKYTDVLTSERIFDEDGELVLELAYDDYIQVLQKYLDQDSAIYKQVKEMADKAYEIARDPNEAITLLVQGANLYSLAAVALNP
jgi:5,10-methenyltetrahydromethanopterin hydrogenase